jgi:proline iminopeptidase
MSFHQLPAFVLYIALLCGCSPAKISASTLQQEGYISSTDDVKLFYQVKGSGRDTIVVLHGGPGLDIGYLAPDLEPLAQSHVLIFYDQRGAGKSTLISDSSSVSIDKHIDDLEAVRQYFKLNKLKLLGHSWGALLAARYVLKYEQHVSKIVFSSPAPLRRHPYWQQASPIITRWMDSATLTKVRDLNRARFDTTIDARKSCDAFWKIYINGYFGDPLDTATINRMLGGFCSGSSASIRNGMKINPYVLASIGNWDWRNDFNHLNVPVLTITGNSDINPSEVMHEWDQAFPNSKLVLIDGAGHYPQVEKPLIYFENVRAFLR